MDNRYSLIIGISEYEDKQYLPTLKKAEADAQRVANLLYQHGYYQPKILRGNVTANKLYQELKVLLEDRANGKEALIFFTGHGIKGVTKGEPLRSPTVFLAGSDCQINKEGDRYILSKGYVSIEAFQELIDNSHLTSLVIFIDSCHSGDLLERNFLERIFSVVHANQNFFCIASCRRFEEAKAKITEEHSVFTQALLEGLLENNATPDGRVSADSLWDYIFDNLNNRFIETSQQPIHLAYGGSITLVRYHNLKREKNINENCPYPGLRFFEEQDKHFFFGRERKIRELLEKIKLKKVKLIPVIGASGSGKSSVVRAGLIPKLREENWQILSPLLPGETPLNQFKNVLEEFLKENQVQQEFNFSSVEELVFAIKLITETSPLLIFVDQFEEIFTLCANEAERSQFIDLLIKVAESNQDRLAIVITLRADFLSACWDYPPLAHKIENTVYVLPLEGADLEQAITCPAGYQGYDIEPGLLGAIINDIVSEKNSLPLLQFALRELWERDCKKHKLTLDTYQKFQGVKGLLDRHAEDVYKTLITQQEKDWVKRIFLSLVRTDEKLRNTKQRQSQEKLLTLVGSKDERGLFKKVFNKLVDGRLVVVDQEWVELVHEALMEKWERLKKWLQEDTELRQLIEKVETLRQEENLPGLKLQFQIKKKWDDLRLYLDSETQDWCRQRIESLNRTINFQRMWGDENTPFAPSPLTHISPSSKEDMETQVSLKVEESRLPVQITVEDDRTGMSIETIKRAFIDQLFYVQGKSPANSTLLDYYLALAYAVRDRLLSRWIATSQTYTKKAVRTVCYLSPEYLIGPQLGNNLINSGIYEQVRQAIEEFGLDLNNLIDIEKEPGLGFGRLGQIASSYMDSLATMEIPACGYGIRYEFGTFTQTIQDGWQVEVADNWLQIPNPWEIARLEEAVEVKFGGHTESYVDKEGNYRVCWVYGVKVKGVPYDVPIAGYKVNSVNNLRLWKSEPYESFDFQSFNVGDYYSAVNQQIDSANVSRVLYPNDEVVQGKNLRISQEYFLVSCSLQDIIRTHLLAHPNLDNLHEKFAIQISDTRLAFAVPELMRLLVDEYHIGWDKAWEITTKTFSYTVNDWLPAGLIKDSLPLLNSCLPRHLEIIHEINRRFLNQCQQSIGDVEILSNLNLVDETGDKSIYMTNLACIGSYRVNGNSPLHTELLKFVLLNHFYKVSPEKFSNKTVGVTPRRWMLLSNPELAQLITEKIGDNWLNNLDELKQLEYFGEDQIFCERWRQVKQKKKQDLATYVYQTLGLTINPESLFDIQAKAIHQYRRQHLNILHIITLYNRIKQSPDIDIVPRTFIFAGKAATGYLMAKLIIKLINSVAEVINYDPDVKDRLKVVFLPNFNVTLGQRIYPAADLSEQISTAGKELTNIGSLKFAMNGAITIGTLDGTNIEIREEVGEENFFLFGLTFEEIYFLKANGHNPVAYYESNTELKEALDRIASGYFSHGDTELFKPIVDSLLFNDDYMLLADYQSYIDCQENVSQAYRDRNRWLRMSILNVARMGKFSSDRAIREYCQEIWNVEPISVNYD